jgi:hypothetical protein
MDMSRVRTSHRTNICLLVDAFVSPFALRSIGKAITSSVDFPVAFQLLFLLTMADTVQTPWETSGEAFIARLEELARSGSWDQVRSLMARLVFLNRNNLVAWTVHPMLFTELLDLIFFASAPPVDIVGLICSITGKSLLTNESNTSGTFPLHALLTAFDDSTPTIVSLVCFFGRIAPETALLRSAGERPIDIVTTRLRGMHAVIPWHTGGGPHHSLSSRQYLDSGVFLWTCAYHLVHMMSSQPTVATDPGVDMLHCTLRARHVLPVEFIELVLSRYYLQLSEADVLGNLPLHIAVAAPCPVRDQEGEDDDEDQRDVKQHDDDVEILKQVLEGYQYAAHVPNPDGKLALQMALEAGFGWKDEFVQQLISCTPNNFLKSIPNRSETSDHLLLTELCKQRGSVATVYYLLKSNPMFFSQC